MTLFASFAVAAAPWQNFYILTGTAAATLVGLMFIAVTFGASLVTPETVNSTRAFLDPSFSHFVQVLLIACLMEIPTMSGALLGVVLLGLCLVRASGLFTIFVRMKEASQKYQDIELQDWMTGVILPLLCYLLLGATGGAFMAGYAMAFNGLALIVVVLLMVGVISAWELFVWMAMARNRVK